MGRGPGRLRDGEVEGRLHPAVEEGRHQPRQLGLLLLGQGGYQRQVHQQRQRQRSHLRDVNDQQNFVDYVFFFKILKICGNKSRINYSKNKTVQNYFFFKLTMIKRKTYIHLPRLFQNELRWNFSYTARVILVGSQEQKRKKRILIASLWMPEF